MRNLWRGEVTCRQPLPGEQEDCAVDKYFTPIVGTSSSEAYVSKFLEYEPFELLRDDAIRNKSILQSFTNERPQRILDAPASPILKRYRLEQEMSPIVDSYRNERNENLDENFKAMDTLNVATTSKCRKAYDGSKNKYNL